MDNKRFELIKKLTEVQSASGFEHNIREVIRDEITPYVEDIQQDGLGGIFGLRKAAQAEAPTVMVAAHMDEVGFMLAAITEEGFFRVIPLGGWKPTSGFCPTFYSADKQGELPSCFLIYSTALIARKREQIAKSRRYFI